MEKLFRQQEPPKGGGVFRTGRLFPAPENLCALRGKLEEGDFCSNSRVAIGKYPTKECVRILEVSVGNYHFREGQENVDGEKVLALVE